MVTPGNVVIVATLPDGRTVKREVSVAAGGTEQVELDAAKQEVSPPASKPEAQPAQATPAPATKAKKSGSLRPYAYVAGAVGVAGLATFAVAGLMNKSKYDDLKSNCPDGHCGPGKQDDIDGGRRLQTIANIGLVVGVVGIGAGTTLFLLSGDAPNTERTATVRVRVSPGFASVSGSF